MAPDKKDKKRKAAAPSVSDPPMKKSKNETKSEQNGKVAAKSVSKKKGASVSSKQSNGEDAASAVKINGEPARQIKPRKRAADFLSDDEDGKPEAAASETQDKTQKTKSGSKKTKKDDNVSHAAVDEQVPKIEKNNKNVKTDGKAKKVEEAVEKNDESSASDSGADEDENGEDDQTVALLKGFESSGDEDASEDEGYDPSQPVPRIPDSKKIKRKLLKKQKKSSAEVEEPGTIYIGRIPHGFYENQMRAYFSQFGDITHLRLSRNRLTGRSKHYAFIEFSSSSVAKIAAETMDNYLMFGHILKCKFIPQEQVHPELWKGADRRFKRTPWNRMEKKKLEQGKPREKWSRSIAAEGKKRRAKAEKMKALGYEIELPKLTNVDEVPEKETKAIEPSESVSERQDPVKAIEAPAKKTEGEKEILDTSKESKKGSKDKKTKEEKIEDEQPQEEVKTKKELKPKKGKEDKKEKKASKEANEQDAPKEDGAKKVMKKAAEPGKDEGKTKKTEKTKSKQSKARA